MDAIEAIYVASGFSRENFSLLFCAFVAGVVSFNACALTLCQSNDFTLGRTSAGRNERNVFGAALRHAFWHAFLFLAYLVAIQLVSWIAFLLATVLAEIAFTLAEALSGFMPFLKALIPENIAEFFVSFKRTFNTFIGVATVVLVWLTYRSKGIAVKTAISNKMVGMCWWPKDREDVCFSGREV